MKRALWLVLLTTPAVAATGFYLDSIGCTTLTKRDVKQRFGVKGVSAFVCANYTTGEVLGGIQRSKDGALTCDIAGYSTGPGCAMVWLCGEGPREICL